MGFPCWCDSQTSEQRERERILENVPQEVYEEIESEESDSRPFTNQQLRTLVATKMKVVRKRLLRGVSEQLREHVNAAETRRGARFTNRQLRSVLARGCA